MQDFHFQSEVIGLIDSEYSIAIKSVDVNKVRMGPEMTCGNESIWRKRSISAGFF